MYRLKHRLFVLCMLLPLIAAQPGCMLGPNYERPATPADLVQSFARKPADWVDPNEPGAIGQWWKSFDDPLIDEMVQRALTNNYDLKAAAASVLQAVALLEQSHGLRLPAVTYSTSRTRAKSYSPAAPISTAALTSYSHQLNISYIADFFGKLRRAEAASYDDLLSAQASQQALVHAIIAQVVRSRVRIATQQRLLDLVTANIKSRQSTLQIVERRYSQGLVNAIDIYLARENIAAAAGAEPQLNQSVIQARHSLDVLLGQTPATLQEADSALGDPGDLSAVPTGLPAALLDRRPDIRAAEMQLAAATERIGVNIATMFPDLTLSASGGYRSGSFSMAAGAENQVYSMALSLAGPIFQGGRLKAGVRAAKAHARQMAANYAKTVLNAMREVEDALVAEQMQSRRFEQLQARLRHAVQAEKLAMERYSQGLDSILAVLETERRRRGAENELTTTNGQLFETRIDLFLALGGDWQTEPQPDEKTL